MADEPGPTGDLQFDKVEPKAPAEPSRPACAGCTRPIEGTYFTINGRAICAACRDAIGRELTGGSASARFFKSLAFGVGGAALGSGIYYAVYAISNTQWGIIAVAVGYIVGSAVRKGSGGRGGWVYQLMAVVLTYVSICTSYVPIILQEITKGELSKQHYRVALKSAGPRATDVLKEVRAAGASDAETVVRNGGRVKGLMGKSDAEALARTLVDLGADAAVEDERVGRERPGAGMYCIGIAVLFVFSLAAPFLAGFENFLMWLILGFALFEAWKLNAANAIRIEGPFRVAAS